MLGDGKTAVRHPGWQRWDFTLARRIPVNIGRAHTFAVDRRVRRATNPVNFGITVRMDY